MKRVPQISLEEAAAKVKTGNTLLVGGFGMTGNPVHLLHALAETGVRDLIYIANNVSEAGLGGGRMLRNGQIKRAIGSFFTSNPEAVAASQEGRMEVELLPQGSLAEALRAGGAGIGGFFTPASAGTLLGEKSETRVIGGKVQVFVPGLRGDVAFVRAWKADTAGNLAYRMTEQNFNKAMATAADLVIAEAEMIVPVGEIDASEIHTPGCYVDYLVQAHTTLEDLGTSASVASSDKKVDPLRMNMARRALAELSRGDVVNLGIGIPTLVADLITPEHGIILHSENGMVGVGPAPVEGGALEFPVNAGKIAMIRGGHIDVAIMGGLQVDERANLANWAVPGKPLLGVGGAMDLASGAKRLIITMTHSNRDGSAKIVPECDLPLTAANVVDMVITELAVFSFEPGELTLIEVMPGASLEQVRASTSAKFAERLGG
jgi:3-oxoacid CoA-transferase